MEPSENTLELVLVDPVCGRPLTEAQALLRTEYEGRTYLFCSEHCRMLFAVRPDSFVGHGEPAREDLAPAS